jgi:formylglycine-generating enzyme required for sulfatase activity
VNRPVVFLSSTAEDLESTGYRAAARDAALAAGFYPEMQEYWAAKDNPPLTECLTKVVAADVLVVVVAYRFGWVPPDQPEKDPKKLKSITWLECEKAKADGKDALAFLVDKDYQWPQELREEYELILAFQENRLAPELQAAVRWRVNRMEDFKAWLNTRMRVTFTTPEDLQRKVESALLQWRNEHGSRWRRREVSRASRPKDGTEASLEAEIRSYLAKADSLYANLPVAGFVTQLKVPIDIADIYIPLRALVDLRGVSEEPFADAADAEKCLRGGGMNLEISLPAGFEQCDSRKRRGIVVLGDPGAGKTTHMKRLLLWCARNGPQSIGLPEGMVPVFLALRDLSHVERGLEDFLQAQLGHPHLAVADGFARRLLKRGNLLLLFDGLDEVADPDRRHQVSQWIGEALRVHPSCRFVVTSRYAGYGPDVALSEQFLEMHIRPLSAEQAQKFIRTWFRIVETGLARDQELGQQIAVEKADKLIARLREPEFRAQRIFELTRNPLLLTNLCLVHRHRGTLPKRRARLYDECIDVLLEHWRTSKGLEGMDASQARRALQPVALWMHQQSGRTRATATELAPVVEPALKDTGWPGGSAAGFLTAVRDRSGLLTGWGRDRFGFMHLGFQEYLAAREIRRRAFKEPEVLKDLAGRFGDSWWQEVALLLLALEDPSLFEPYMREVVQRPEFAQFPALVDICLEDAVEVSTVPFLELLQANPGGESELWQRQLAAVRVLARLDPQVLAALHDRLARHPSKDIRALVAGCAAGAEQEVWSEERSGYELVLIPGGTFNMGSLETESGRYGNEGPVHEVRVAGFQMGRYPVTNAQYARFLKADPGVAEPAFWADRRFNQAQQPVVGVGWEDARRFARWAGLRLPTEAEWEYACRAGTTTRFYTGDEDEDLGRAGWYGANAGGQPHAVGGKEPNKFGLYDMHGNVWEWVEDDWHNSYEGAPQDGEAWIDAPRRAYRVVRGAGWDNGAGCCRSAARDWYDPHPRYGSLGFRLSRSAP